MTNFGYTVYNASINFGYIGRNFGYFWVFWRIFFGYTGIPLPLLADPVWSKKVEILRAFLKVMRS